MKGFHRSPIYGKNRSTNKTNLNYILYFFATNSVKKVVWILAVKNISNHCTKAQNLWVKMKILNPVSCDISQKLRQTKCVLFKI